MRLFPSLTLVVASTLLLPGCLSVKYSAQRAIDYGATSGDVHRGWQHSIFLGLIPVSAVPLDSYCPDTGVLHVRSQIGPLGMLATVATLGVWTPSRIKVTCADWPAVAEGPPYAPQETWSAEPEPTWAPEPEPTWDPAWEPAWSDAPPLGIPADPTFDADTVIIEDESGTRVIIVR